MRRAASLPASASPRLASILIAASLALSSLTAAAQTPPAPPPGPPLPATPTMVPGYMLPGMAMRHQDQDMYNGGIALLIAGGIGAVVGMALLVRSDDGISLTREVGGAVALSAAGLSFVAAIPLLVIGGKKVPVNDTQVSVGLGSVKVRF